MPLDVTREDVLKDLFRRVVVEGRNAVEELVGDDTECPLPGKISVPAGRMSRDRDDVLLFGEEDRGTPMSEKVDEGVVGAEDGPLEGIGKDETRMKVWSRVVIAVFAVGVEGERMVR